MTAKSNGGISAESLTVDQAIANLQQTADESLRYYAAWWLGRFRVRQPQAIAALLAALDDETEAAPDGSYPLRRNAARALGKLGDTQAVPALTDCLDCSDYYVREAAAQALAALGDARCVPALRALLAGGVAAANPVPGKPHLVQPYGAVIEALGSLGATAAIDDVAEFQQHPVPQVRNAAGRALYQLTSDPAHCQPLIEALRGPDLQLRRSALMDLGAVGFLPAADAIATTPAENSLKLIALQGLLETHLRQQNYPASPLTSAARRLMGLMDTLL